MSTIPDLLESSYDGFPVNDLIVTIHHAADKAETHQAFRGDLPEYVSRAPQLREMADALGVARDAAAGRDVVKVAELKAAVAAAKQALSMNALHIVMLSLRRNDPTLLLNAGYEPKVQRSVGKVKVHLLDLTPDVFVKHGTTSGALVVLVKRVNSKAIMELQMTNQDPSMEDAWKGCGEGMYNRSRIEMKGFEPATRVYFRARYHEDGGIGRWSSPVGLIVL